MANRDQFQSGGRRRGSASAFIHSSPGHGTSPDHLTRAHLPTHNLTSPPLPPGVCRFYWTKGQCEKDDCLTDEGLANVTGTRTVSLLRQPANLLGPGEVQSKLQWFLVDDFHFSKIYDIYAFLTLTNSAVSTSSSWVCVTFTFQGPV